ncbi:uncharacterized protein LOC119865587 isoform X1 [Canis lupus familiaris]|uniref:uncharacterized protein LOC119865587 isoform X1 n=1 Tax=Canis lupus familiaris TaxID=9615 RepID=UPI0018F7DD1E|nr:uncharacterized protein LOC119865587 isoform X1 [Canis lupus familiaris]
MTKGAADETAAGTAPRATEGTTVVPDPLLQHRPRQWASCAPPPPGPAEDVPASRPAWTDTAPQRRQRRGQREKEGHSPASAPSPHSTGSSHPPVARVRKRGLTSSFPIGRARSHVAGSIRPRGALTPPAACERFTCRQKLREDFTWRRPLSCAGAVASRRSPRLLVIRSPGTPRIPVIPAIMFWGRSSSHMGKPCMDVVTNNSR